ncbi:lipase family alpha/beta hydrolase [Marisediminicola senii]|uniref:lipase family alpha/beta hydrolase n=1 Tax=Marisediminicola senii TaxID=2711233 RepID=UPI0013EDB3D0|nr:alpha/beta hydrolase [Marisediminicola senii]
MSEVPSTLVRRLWLHYVDWVYAAYWEARHAIAPRATHDFTSGSLVPVLLLPGVYETWRFLEPVAALANALGHPVHVVPSFGYNRGSIPSMAELAQRYLDDNDLRDVIIIAHSKGGLIGKHMMVTDDTDGRIARIITVNTPFGGSVWARYALRRTLREFSPNDVTLAALTGLSASNARITSIYSADDPIIPGGSELAGAVNITLPLVGHFRVLSSPLLLSTIRHLLRPPAGP